MAKELFAASERRERKHNLTAKKRTDDYLTRWHFTVIVGFAYIERGVRRTLFADARALS